MSQSISLLRPHYENTIYFSNLTIEEWKKHMQFVIEYLDRQDPLKAQELSRHVFHYKGSRDERDQLLALGIEVPSAFRSVGLKGGMFNFGGGDEIARTVAGPAKYIARTFIKGNENEAIRNFKKECLEMRFFIPGTNVKVRGEHRGGRFIAKPTRQSKNGFALYYKVKATGPGTFKSPTLGYEGEFLQNFFHDPSGNAVCQYEGKLENTGSEETDIKREEHLHYKGSILQGKFNGQGILSRELPQENRFYNYFDGIWRNHIPINGVFYNHLGNEIRRVGDITTPAIPVAEEILELEEEVSIEIDLEEPARLNKIRDILPNVGLPTIDGSIESHELRVAIKQALRELRGDTEASNLIQNLKREGERVVTGDDTTRYYSIAQRLANFDSLVVLFAEDFSVDYQIVEFIAKNSCLIVENHFREMQSDFTECCATDEVEQAQAFFQKLSDAKKAFGNSLDEVFDKDKAQALLEAAKERKEKRDKSEKDFNSSLEAAGERSFTRLVELKKGREELRKDSRELEERLRKWLEDNKQELQKQIILINGVYRSMLADLDKEISERKQEKKVEPIFRENFEAIREGIRGRRTSLEEEKRKKVRDLNDKIEKLDERLEKLANRDNTQDAGLINEMLNRVESIEGQIQSLREAQLSTFQNIPSKAFGPEQWIRNIGEIEIEDIPQLPEDIEEKLKKPCPYFSYWPFYPKTLADTHLLVLIPRRVNQIDLSINRLNELIQSARGGNRSRFNKYAQTIRNVEGDKPITSSYWLLISKEVIPYSRGKSYDEVENLIQGSGYSVPKAIEVATALFTHYLGRGERLCSSQPITFSYCKEYIGDEHRVCVGNFKEEGLSLAVPSNTEHSLQSYGLLAAQRFSYHEG